MKEKHGKIIIVDNDEAILKSYKAYLDPYFEVYTATNVDKAIIKFREAQEDYVAAIIDLSFKNKEKDGLRLVRFISEKYKTACIILTGHATLETAIEATEYNVVIGYVKKEDDDASDKVLNLALKATETQLNVNDIRSLSVQEDEIAIEPNIFVKFLTKFKIYIFCLIIIIIVIILVIVLPEEKSQVIINLIEKIIGAISGQSK